ncbi:MAG: glycosyltransferase, partial [Bacteroidia bacterium]|nr:glycosyltransferase [Bacteroidia bacterium]
MKNGIVIPCYNEADRLDFNNYRQFILNNPDYQLCFVNDGSKDATLKQLNSFKISVGEQVMVHNMPVNGGKAEAVRQGVKLMEKETRVDNIGFLDADLATGFDDYKRLVDHLNQNNLKMVFGSRKLNKNIKLKRTGFRKFASLIISMIINLITKMDIKDTQCGAKVFSRNIIKRIFRDSFHSRWLFDVEIFIRIKNYFGSNSVMSQVSELGLNSWNEVDGSKITLKDSLKFPITLIELTILYNINPKIEEINRVLKSTATY